MLIFFKLLCLTPKKITSNKQINCYNKQESLHSRTCGAFRKKKEKANGSILALVFTLSPFHVAKGCEA